jgi:lipoprotein Spr
MKKIIITIITFFLITSTKSQDSNRLELLKEPLYLFVHEWWNTPYRYGGTSKKGIDCSAFILRLFKDVYQYELPRTASQQYKISQKVKKEDLKDGDLVFFRNKVKSGWHVGLYLIDGWFIHSTSARGVTVSNINEPKYRSIFYSGGRLKNTD